MSFRKTSRGSTRRKNEIREEDVEQRVSAAVTTAVTQANAAAAQTVSSAVNTAIANLANTAPAALDTFAEVAAALNNDASFANTITQSLAARVSRSNGTVLTASTSSNVVRNITLSTANPSGGMDGDVWLKYTP